MTKYTKDELTKALETVYSTIIKCEKIHTKFKIGTSQHSLLINRLNALNISKILLENAILNIELNNMYEMNQISRMNITNLTTDIDLDTILSPIMSIKHKCKQAQNKFEINSLNFNRLTNLVSSMTICEFLIREKLSKSDLNN